LQTLLPGACSCSDALRQMQDVPVATVRRVLFGWTFDPEVEGSNPSRPPADLQGFCRSGNADDVQKDVRHRRTSASGCRKWLRPQRRSLRFAAALGIFGPRARAATSCE